MKYGGNIIQKKGYDLALYLHYTKQ